MCQTTRTRFSPLKYVLLHHTGIFWHLYTTLVYVLQLLAAILHHD